MKTNGRLSENDKSNRRSSGLSILRIPLDQGLWVPNQMSIGLWASMHPWWILKGCDVWTLIHMCHLNPNYLCNLSWTKSEPSWPDDATRSGIWFGFVQVPVGIGPRWWNLSYLCFGWINITYCTINTIVVKILGFGVNTNFREKTHVHIENSIHW